MKSVDSNVPDNVTDKIGEDPMDNDSEDWEEFVNNTKNLTDVKDEGFFYTDYGVYSLICLASSKKRQWLRRRDIKRKNVPAVYERTRNSIVATQHPDKTIFNKINKINGINSYLEKTTFKLISIPEGSFVFIGDNWYIIYYCGNIISSCVLDFDKKALVEFEITKNKLNEYDLTNKQHFNINQVEETLEGEGNIRTLKINH